MNMNASKTNGAKLLVAIMALALVFTGAVVIFSDSEVYAETTASDFIALDTDGDKKITLTANTVISDAATLDGYTIDCATFTIEFKDAVDGGTNGLILNGSANEFVKFSGAGKTVANVTVNGTNSDVTAQKAIVMVSTNVTFNHCTLNAMSGAVYTMSIYIDNTANNEVKFDDVTSNNALVRFCLDNSAKFTVTNSTLYGVAIVNGFDTGTASGTVGTSGNFSVDANTTIGITYLGTPAGDARFCQSDDQLL